MRYFKVKYMRTTINLDDKLSLRVKEYCDKRGHTFTGLIRVLLREKMERDPIGKR